MRRRKYSLSLLAAVRSGLLRGEAQFAVARSTGMSLSGVHRLARSLDLPKRQEGPPMKMSPAQIIDARARRLRGETVASIASTLNATIDCVRYATRRLADMRKAGLHTRRRAKRHISIEEREEIARGTLTGESAAQIARRLRRAPSTVSRELARTGGRESYRAWKAEDRFLQQIRRPKKPKLAAMALRQRVERALENFWSPEQIAAHLRSEFPTDSSMNVSHETIYRSLFVQGRGALRTELKQYLRRRGKSQRKGDGAPRGKIKDMVAISERPAEAEDRAVPGHWEGDLIIGRGGKSAIATLVERRSRFVMLVALPNGRTAEEVRKALVGQITSLPDELRKTLTWDQGKEMAQHAVFTIDTGMKVFFCEPHSPWQRGSNENTNGLLRQFLPRTANLSAKTQSELNRIAGLMNGRPRQTLGWRTPSAVLNEAVVANGAMTG